MVGGCKEGVRRWWEDMYIEREFIKTTNFLLCFQVSQCLFLLSSSDL